MRPEHAALLAAVVVAGCVPHAPMPVASAAPAAASAAPSPSTTATPLPVHVSGHGRASAPTILTQSVGGRRIYTIRALSFSGDIAGTGNGVATLEQPHVTFVDRSGTTTVADAPKATVTQRDKSIVMSGGVRAKTSDGDLMRCDTLRYNGRAQRFFGQGDVVLTGTSGLVLRGNYFTGDVRMRDVRVTRYPPR